MRRMVVAARIAKRELRAGLGGFRVFLVCLALGVAAITAVGGVRSGIEDGLKRNGAQLLGGDAQMEFTYRYASPAERAWMAGQALSVSQQVDFSSMAVVKKPGGAVRALAQVRGVDGLYPLYGALSLAPKISTRQALADNGAVMARGLADRLGIAPGDKFRLGNNTFSLRAILLRAPDDAGAIALAPPLIVRSGALKGAGLLAPGSLFRTKYSLKLRAGSDLQALQAKAETKFRDTGMRWRDARNAAPGMSRFIDRMAAFLVLVGLAGLAVGGVGVSAAVTAYLEGKTEVIATLKTLGAESRVIFAAYLMQIGALAVLGIAIGLVLGGLAPLALAPLIEARLPLPLHMTLRVAPLAQAALYGALTALIFTLWPLARAGRIRAAALYRDAGRAVGGWPGWRVFLITCVLVGALVGAAALGSGEPRLALWAAGGIAGALLVLVVAAWGVRGIARRGARARWAHGHPALRMALGAVGGPGGETVSVVLSLGLGLSVLAAIGQINANMQTSIAKELPTRAPSFFVVDIQPAQMKGFLDRTKGDPGVTRVQTAPMLRGVITRINGKPAREVVGNSWVIRGDRGVTMSDVPPKNTVITAGQWWPKGYRGPPQISFSAHEASEMGLKLGDRLSVNILGRDIVATISSFRVVDFSTAGIGFIMAMNPSALAGAPYTSIATIYARPSAEAGLLRDLSRAYPNITIIRVRDAIGRVAEVLKGLAAAITYGAMATLVTGIFVLIGAAAAGQPARVFEAAVLRTVGASRAQVLAYFALRSAMLGAAAGGVAVFAGGVAGWAVIHFVMKVDFSFASGSALEIVLGGVVATLLAGLVFAWRPLSLRPASVLRARE